jgi:hypothetical protein
MASEKCHMKKKRYLPNIVSMAEVKSRDNLSEKSLGQGKKLH